MVSLRSSPNHLNRIRLQLSHAAISEGIDKITENTQATTTDVPQIFSIILIDNGLQNRATMVPRFQNFWECKLIQSRLDQIRSDFSSDSNLRAYTDGSLIRTDGALTHTTLMGCGWCILKENNESINFKGQVETFTSSTRAELFAILTVIYATPRGSRLCLFTDSQVAIDAISQVSANPKKAHRKLQNWTIIKAIDEIARAQALFLRLEKVKAHSGLVHNDTADQLAKEGCRVPVCCPDLQSLASINVVGYWRGETVEEPLRQFIKRMGKAKHSLEWRQLNRNTTTISDFKSNQICWDVTWKMTMLSDLARNITNNKDNRNRAFNVKLLNNELPTLEKLRDRFPSVYRNNYCVRCNMTKEDQVHVLTCPKNIIDIQPCRK